jgi:uncharacterized protein YhaN
VSKIRIEQPKRLTEMQMLELEAACEKAKKLVDLYSVQTRQAEGSYTVAAKEHVVGREAAWRMEGIAEQLQMARLMMSQLLTDLSSELSAQRQIRSQEEQS